MIKLCTLIKRRPGLSRKAFAEWWIGRHAPMAVALAGLRRYQISIAVGDGESPYDGMAELWFDSPAALGKARRTRLWAKLSADSAAQAAERIRLVVRENPIKLSGRAAPRPRARSRSRPRRPRRR